ncbi:ATP-binding protein [Heliobacterium chlorum]|uniref:ATP-binding protein n=1 Tax=Heliobacterium chlorum TaxID=2698 RepID=A0ABR7T2X3_HELCL|nr:ATP-binding protein [Heliobacterium chlorum]
MKISKQSSQEFKKLSRPIEKNYELHILPEESQWKNIVNYVLERAYLQELSSTEQFPDEAAFEQNRQFSWMQIIRIPTSPSDAPHPSIQAQWQSVLSACHCWGSRFVFLLIRLQGKTYLCLGSCNLTGKLSTEDAIQQLCQAVTSQLAGCEIKKMSEADVYRTIVRPLGRFPVLGCVTGIPSKRKNVYDSDFVQTLDKVAFGLREQDFETDYSVAIIADPVNDAEIAEIIANYRDFSSSVHQWVKRTSTTSQGQAKGESVNVGASIGSGNLIPVDVNASVGYARYNVDINSQSVGTELVDKMAKYTEELVDKHIQRLQQGRNLGFWNVSVHVHGNDYATTQTILGLLRSIYSGDESYIEPIRLHILPPGTGAATYAKAFSHIPLSSTLNRPKSSSWENPLGRILGMASTPMNTEELSIASSLPRKDVPGLRFVRNAVRFATNPPMLKDKNAPTMKLGRIMDTGIRLSSQYSFNIHSLTRHAFVTGITGSGKSTTCQQILREVVSSTEAPVFVLEPAKEEYVKWAQEMNESLPPEKQFFIYMPGNFVDASHYKKLRLNPFAPAVEKGAPADHYGRCERLSTIFSTSLPMDGILPYIFEEALFETMRIALADERCPDHGVCPSLKEYPTLEEVREIALCLLATRGYTSDFTDQLKAAITTRINALQRGFKKDLFGCTASTPPTELFGRNVVINLSRLANEKDRALVMSLLLTNLFEYRNAKYQHDSVYRSKANEGELCHLAVIEEAHRILRNPQMDFNNTGNPQSALASLFSEMLTEMRSYGQGVMVVDQVPSDLIPNVMKNTNLKIVHRLVSRDDCEAVTASMSLKEEQKDIIGLLPIGEAIVCGAFDDAAAWVEVDGGGTRQ